MSGTARFPERLLLEALYGDEFSERTLLLPYQPGNEALLARLRAELCAALQKISYRERGVLQMRFGLGDGYAYTLAQAGQVFRLTRERVRQIQLKALRKLQNRATALRAFLDALEGRADA